MVKRILVVETFYDTGIGTPLFRFFFFYFKIFKSLGKLVEKKFENQNVKKKKKKEIKIMYILFEISKHVSLMS